MQPLYAQARAQGLTLKAHVGEFGSAEDVRRTVEVLDLDEVQHGIAAAESTDVMQWLAEKGVRLNVCPTSNVMLGVVADLSVHPIRRLHDHGVAVTVNSDDLTVFGQSVSDEYLNLYRAGVFTAEELDGIRVGGARKPWCVTATARGGVFRDRRRAADSTSRRRDRPRRSQRVPARGDQRDDRMCDDDVCPA